MIKIVPSGDTIIILKDLKNLKSSTLTSYIEKLNFDEIEDIISLKNSVGVIFNPYKTTSNKLIKKFKSNISNKKFTNKKNSKTWKIPICYDEEFGIDLNEISKNCKLDIAQIKKKHCSVTYEVDLIGFLPGFLYLGNLVESLYTKRRNNPRTNIPKGSVGIAGNQTGIYNIESPGGWNIIGRTPIKLFDKLNNPPIYIKQGDKIIFEEITKEKFYSYKN